MDPTPIKEPTRYPSNQDRHIIIGSTGSGKSQSAMFSLSGRDFHLMPWVIYNHKYEESIDSLLDVGAHEIGLNEIPAHPGIYIVHPEPESDDDRMEVHMRAIWRRGRTGIYVDEGYMIDRRSPAFSMLLTQGRSKYIPMTILSQRPAWMNRFTFSEANFWQVFRLQHKRDRRTIEEYVPADLETRLPDYESYYYDVGRNKLNIMKPVPTMDAILNVFERRMKKKRVAI